MSGGETNGMSDYNQTRDAAEVITSRFSNMLRNLKDDYEEEILVIVLMEHYSLVDDDEDLLWAIERVLEYFMTTSDFNAWVMSRKDARNG